MGKDLRHSNADEMANFSGLNFKVSKDYRRSVFDVTFVYKAPKRRYQQLFVIIIKNWSVSTLLLF